MGNNTTDAWDIGMQVGIHTSGNPAVATSSAVTDGRPLGFKAKPFLVPVLHVRKSRHFIVIEVHRICGIYETPVVR